LPISQPFQPIPKWILARISQVFQQFDLGVIHKRIVAQKLQIGAFFFEIVAPHLTPASAAAVPPNDSAAHSARRSAGSVVRRPPPDACLVAD